MNRIIRTPLIWLFTALVSLPLPVAAQDTPPALLKQEELDQLLAPVALYPDALLAQILMASTYPLEIVQAHRWAKQNPNLKDKALEDALQGQPWDPAVKSLPLSRKSCR
jgi:hypothetical protein